MLTLTISNKRINTVRKQKSSESGFGALEAILILIIIVLLIVVGFMVYKNQNKSTPVAATTPTGTSKSSTASAKSGTSYTSVLGGYSFKYPAPWAVQGYVNSSGEYISAAGYQLNGSESSFLLGSSTAASNSFGAWFDINSSSSSTSSGNSDFTQIPYAQGTIIKKLSNGISIWQATQTGMQAQQPSVPILPTACIPFETVQNGAFGFKLNNGKYLDVDMSFCYGSGQTTTYTYNQQEKSTQLQQMINILSSIKQN
jgi:hypothetical protein